jgi:hypothetical protein
MFASRGGDWRNGFEYAWQAHAPEPDEGPGVTSRPNSPPASGQGRGTGSSTQPSPPKPTARVAYVPRGPARAVVDHNGRLVDRFSTAEARWWQWTMLGTGIAGSQRARVASGRRTAPRNVRGAVRQVQEQAGASRCKCWALPHPEPDWPAAPGYRHPTGSVPRHALIRAPPLPQSVTGGGAISSL